MFVPIVMVMFGIAIAEHGLVFSPRVAAALGRNDIAGALDGVLGDLQRRSLHRLAGGLGGGCFQVTIGYANQKCS